MGELKPGWQKWRFDQMAMSVKDRVDDPSEAAVEHYIGLEHLDSDSLKIRRWGSPDDVSATKLVFQPGDIIFGRRRAYQRKLGVAEFHGIASAHSLVLRAKQNVVLPEFLPFFMQSDIFMELAQRISVGSLSPTINWKTLAKQEFTLPPLEEQRRLARLFTVADSAAQPPPLQALETVVSALWLEELALGEKLGSRQIKPASWPGVSSTAKLSELVPDTAPICYGIVLRGDHVASGIPALTISDLGSDYSQAHRVSAEIDQSFSRSRIEAGDLIPAIKATIGPIDIVPEGFVGNIQRQLARIRIAPDAPVSTRYVYRLWSSPMYQRYLSSLTVGSTRAELSIGTLKALEVPVLQPQKQSDIVSVLDELDMQRRSLISRWERSRQLFTNLVNTQLSGAA